MLTRVRLEAEGRELHEVDAILQTALDVLVNRSTPFEKQVLFGDYNGSVEEKATGHLRGLAEARAGEFVIEMSTTPQNGIRFVGRRIAFYAKPEALGGTLAEAGLGEDNQPFHEPYSPVEPGSPLEATRPPVASGTQSD